MNKINLAKISRWVKAIKFHMKYGTTLEIPRLCDKIEEVIDECKRKER